MRWGGRSLYHKSSMKALDTKTADMEAYRPAQCLECSTTISSGRQMLTAMSLCSLETASAANKQQWLDM